MNTLKAKQMGETHNAGPIPTLLSIIFGSFALITMKDAQAWVSISAGAVGFIAGCFAIYSHYLSIKEKRKNLKSQN